MKNAAWTLGCVCVKPGTYKLDGILNEVACYQNVPRLADPVDPVNRLRLRHWVPMRFQDMYMVGNREVHTSKHRLMTIEGWFVM